MDYITWHDLVDIGMQLIAAATLIVVIYYNHKKK